MGEARWVADVGS